MLLSEVVGKAARTSPAQIDATAGNVGVALEVIVKFSVFVLHPVPLV